MSGVSLHFISSGDKQQAFVPGLEETTLSGIESTWIIGDVLKALSVLDSGSSDARNAFAHIESALRHIGSLHPDLVTKTI